MQQALRNKQTPNIKRNQEQNTKKQKQICKAHKSSVSSFNAQKNKGKLLKGKCDKF